MLAGKSQLSTDEVFEVNLIVLLFDMILWFLDEFCSWAVRGGVVSRLTIIAWVPTWLFFCIDDAGLSFWASPNYSISGRVSYYGRTASWFELLIELKQVSEAPVIFSGRSFS